MAFGDVVQSNSGTSTSATTSPTLASPTTAGNIIVLTFAADDYNGTPNAGWTQSSEMEQQTFHGGYLWWLTATAAMTIPSYTIGSASRSAWTLVEYAGPFNASPYDGSQGNFVQTSANSITSDALTPTAGDRLLVAALNGQQGASTPALPAWGSITGSFTESKGQLFNGGNPCLTISQLRRIVTANGSTAYTVGGTTDTTHSRSALIIAFKAGVSAVVSDVREVDTGAGNWRETEAGLIRRTEGTVFIPLTSGTLVQTTATATLSATGTVRNQVFTGTLAATLGAATLSATGKVTVGGTAAGTALPATLVGTGIVFTPIPDLVSGTLNVTLDAAALNAAGTVVNQVFAGSLSATLAPAVLLGTGTVVNQVYSGTLTATLASVSATLTGKVTVQGTAAGTLAPATLVATGTVANTVYHGSLSATLGAATLSASGTVVWPVATGTLTVTLDPATLFASSAIYAKARATEDILARTIEGGSGGVRITEGIVRLIGTLTATLDNASLAAVGTVLNRAVLSLTLAPVNTTLTGTVKVQGTAAGTLLPAMLVGTGTTANPPIGTLAVTLAPATLSAFGFIGYVPNTAHLAVTLASATLAASGAVFGALPTEGQLSVTLDDATLLATGHVPARWTPEPPPWNAWIKEATASAAWTKTSSASGLWSPHTPARERITTYDFLRITDDGQIRITDGVNHYDEWQKQPTPANRWTKE